MDKFMWSGCRANYGIKTGKAAFSVTITSGKLCRIGWGTSSAGLNLGHDDQSFGYGGTAKKSTGNSFITYGEPYGHGDTITTLLDMDNLTISYMKNGYHLGEAFRIPHWLAQVSFFPHVLTKDAVMALDFGEGQDSGHIRLPRGFSWISHHRNLVPAPWGDTRRQALAGPQDDVKPEQDDEPQNETQLLQPVNIPYACGPDVTGAGPNQRRLIMLVGLPGSGKTYWAKEYIRRHPQLKFNILSTNLIMERKMPNTKHTYRDRFEKLIKEATDMLNRQLEVASRENGNIIWDQTNVFPSARARKLEKFRGFRKTALVFLPDEETHREWVHNQYDQTGQRVPDKVVSDMKRNFELPRVGDRAGFDEVVYVFGNSPSERREIMDRYKQEAFGEVANKRTHAETEGLPHQENPPMKHRKMEYNKSYGERQFTQSNPYQPDLPYTQQQQAMPPHQRQLALIRDHQNDDYYSRQQPRFQQQYQQQQHGASSSSSSSSWDVVKQEDYRTTTVTTTTTHHHSTRTVQVDDPSRPSRFVVRRHDPQYQQQFNNNDQYDYQQQGRQQQQYHTQPHYDDDRRRPPRHNNPQYQYQYQYTR
eukprot:TRINITY_DN66502_c6_g2_i1.p1 TRINITY_DN66502_c6_g2~~TRINITY_DN66502_c6_g2_i1.p1  ORF type:complete len:620 (+),score=61.39 TRINITY_DN66502_c6_g2_i1:95-1861(+)